MKTSNVKHYCVISHTHWDREWYREFEIFRMRLLRVFDNVLHLLENNRIPCFYFDGQVSALEDYLEMRPEKLDLVKPEAVIIDLASNPGGVDRKAAREKGLKVIWALSLPAKVAPLTSAEFIKETLYHVLKEL